MSEWTRDLPTYRCYRLENREVAHSQQRRRVCLVIWAPSQEIEKKVNNRRWTQNKRHDVMCILKIVLSEKNASSNQILPIWTTHVLFHIQLSSIQNSQSWMFYIYTRLNLTMWFTFSIDINSTFTRYNQLSNARTEKFP